MSKHEERQRKKRTWLRGSTAKRWLVLGFDGLADVLPGWALRGCLAVLVAMARASYRLPGQPARASCEAVAQLAERAGYSHEPRAIYDRLLDQLHTVARYALDLRCGRGGSPTEHFVFAAEDVASLEGVLKEYGGVVLAVGHNVGAVYSALALSELIPTVVIARGEKHERRQALTRAFFEQAGVEVVMVRDLASMSVSRTCLRALRSGKMLVATVDAIYRKPNRIQLEMFGEPVTLGPWAFRFAMQCEVPVLPVYIRTDDGRLSAEWGEPLVADSVEAHGAHFARFLEDWILRDPGSWGFLLDKRWRRILIAAASRAQ